MSVNEVYMITPISPTYLKQKAKKLKKSHNLLMCVALDEVSRVYGFSNYRHYLNVFKSNQTQSKNPILEYIEYFKIQVNNLIEDYKTQTPYFDDVIGDYLYQYNPKHFDIEEIIMSFDVDEKNFNLTESQDIIAYYAGFEKWQDMLDASESDLKLAKLLFDNKNNIDIEDWHMYIVNAEHDNHTTFDPESKIEILNKIFLNIW